jgi:ATP synthase F1, gamma subunit
MPSLKEVKTRIGSVKSTRKITNAMKMVASSKLHHAQRAIECMRPYEKRLASIMTRFLSTMEGEVESVYSETREIRKVALVVISSNSSLCGAFNANIIKEFLKTAEEYKQKGVVVEVFPIGKKIAQAVQKAGYKFQSDNSDVLEHPEYIKAYNIAENFMQRFVNGEIDKVCIISQHFVNTSKQEICNNTFLPISLDDSANSKATPKSSNKGRQLDYIVEPSPASIISSLIPATLHMQIFSAILDSLAAEHASRVVAMQVATDNADDLIEQLTLTYNKTRQQAITSELLDMASGTFQ